MTADSQLRVTGFKKKRGKYLDDRHSPRNNNKYRYYVLTDALRKEYKMKAKFRSKF
jgi:hypothetical protein